MRCKRAGYATDPQYASKLVSVIQQMKNAGEQAVKALYPRSERFVLNPVILDAAAALIAQARPGHLA
ncbi:flagellar rod assembly protein/muramidase FlgJ [Serratia marcescens]|uniref:Flagellar rod assembly protein/muramidase FlgJ n=1 Tax=Serratia marcescens TaxID=615 RepID=A0A379Z7G1_SERMA|nr:flagellar rod assembly protein/muramidase FlgJ [Serratia marcescens]